MAFFGISAFAVLAAAAAMHSFLEVGKALDKITQQRVPSALSSLEISRQAERIVAVAPALLTVGTPSQREELTARITAEIEQLDRLLSGLQASGSDAAVIELIERDVAQLETNLDALDALVAKRLEAGEYKTELLRRLSHIHNAAQRLITPGLMVAEGDLSQLRKILGNPDLSGEARVSALSSLVDSMAASPPLQRAQIETLNINNKLLRIASAPRPAEVEILAFPVRRALDVLENLAAGIGPMLRARLLARLKEYRDLVDGPDSILQARERELAILADSERLLGENAALSGELTETVSLLVADAKTDIRDANLDALSVQRLSTGVLVAVVALSLISSILIVWLYVGRNLIARLTALSDSMMAIARGQLEARIPAAGRDEIGDMAQALAVFRDTAIEVRDTNLREIREVRQRLVDAIESISEGFSLFDSEDRLVVSNTRYRELLYPDAEDTAERGTPFETIIRKAAERGYIEGAKGRVDEWLSERLSQHRDPGGPQLQQRADGRWIQVSERKTDDGSTVAVYTDITQLKQAEQASRESQQFLGTLVDSIPAVVFFRGLDRRYIRVNHKYEEVYQVTDESIRGKTLHDVFPIDRADDYAANDREAIEQHRVMKREETYVVHGEEHIFDALKFPILDASGEVIAVGGVDYDITERKRAEEELQAAYGIIKDQKERMESELNVGREIQMSMIPLEFPPFPDHDEFSIYAALEPAREVGGDFYDYYFLDEERLCFCVGDVSGKGVPAALFMAVTKTLIKSRAIDDFSTASILTHVNAELSADTKSSMFVTIFLGILNIRTGEFVYTNAGHNPPFLRRKGGSLQRLDIRHGPMIGAVRGMVYREDTDTMTPRDMLFMYTDGVTEQRNADRELFSEKRLVSVLASTTVDSVENAVRDTVAAVKDFQGDGNQEDDITVLAVQFQRSSMHDPIAVFHIMARNDLREIAKVNQEFQKFAEEHGIPVDIGRRISILFDDLLSNVISYAFPDDEAHEIEIRTELATNRLTVTISDDGIPFNPLGAGTPDTDLPLDKRALGGLGIHLIRNLVDDMSYQRRVERNVLTLVKHIE
jgi:PAS domain S-box-containing protein